MHKIINLYRVFWCYIGINVLSGRCPQNHKCPAIWACPVGAIKQSGNKAPEIDKEKCTKCGICVNYCPYGAFRQ